MSENNKIALVTGGSRGLGKNMVMSLAGKGLDIILTYHQNKDAADEVVSAVQSLGSQAYSLQLDTRDTGKFDEFVTALKALLEKERGSAKIDYLVNNAGTALYAPVTEVTEAQVDAAYNIHYKGAFFLTQKVLPFINEGGGIVNISSGLTRITMPGTAIYGSIKAAVETLTRYLAKELGPRKIRANVVAPGAIETDFGGGNVRDNPQMNAQIAGATALGRVGLPDDIGGVVAFLCSDEAYWITGQRIEVSGGQQL